MAKRIFQFLLAKTRGEKVRALKLWQGVAYKHEEKKHLIELLKRQQQAVSEQSQSLINAQNVCRGISLLIERERMAEQLLTAKVQETQLSSQCLRLLRAVRQVERKNEAIESRLLELRKVARAAKEAMEAGDIEENIARGAIAH